MALVQFPEVENVWNHMLGTQDLQESNHDVSVGAEYLLHLTVKKHITAGVDSNDLFQFVISLTP